MSVNKRKTVKRETCKPVKDRRKKTRQVHVIDDESTERDIAIAQADLTNYFLGVMQKHHGDF